MRRRYKPRTMRDLEKDYLDPAFQMSLVTSLTNRKEQADKVMRWYDNLHEQLREFVQEYDAGPIDLLEELEPSLDELTDFANLMFLLSDIRRGIYTKDKDSDVFDYAHRLMDNCARIRNYLQMCHGVDIFKV